jgi:hypothetical protein
MRIIWVAGALVVKRGTVLPYRYRNYVGIFK